jgi:hypothetical protein
VNVIGFMAASTLLCVLMILGLALVVIVQTGNMLVACYVWLLDVLSGRELVWEIAWRGLTVILAVAALYAIGIVL